MEDEDRSAAKIRAQRGLAIYFSVLIPLTAALECLLIAATLTFGTVLSLIYADCE